MDSFIDKLAQRKNAQEMIRANAMAEAEEKQKMAVKLTEYEQAMQEMRKCGLVHMENAEKMKELLAASLQKIEDVQKKDDGDSEALRKSVEEMKTLLAEQKTAVEELFRTAEDFNHKEAVKVYRNVQAVVEGALPKQTEEITAAIKNMEVKKSAQKQMFMLWALMLLAAANVAIEVLRILRYL